MRLKQKEIYNFPSCKTPFQSLYLSYHFPRHHARINIHQTVDISMVSPSTIQKHFCYEPMGFSCLFK